jgi:hypothetical protein
VEERKINLNSLEKNISNCCAIFKQSGQVIQRCREIWQKESVSQIFCQQTLEMWWNFGKKNCANIKKMSSSTFVGGLCYSALNRKLLSTNLFMNNTKMMKMFFAEKISKICLLSHHTRGHENILINGNFHSFSNQRKIYLLMHRLWIIEGFIKYASLIFPGIFFLNHENISSCW